jgi:hypothetical protein
MDMDAVALLNAGQLKSGTLNKPPEFPGSQEIETDENRSDDPWGLLQKIKERSENLESCGPFELDYNLLRIIQYSS